LSKQDILEFKKSIGINPQDFVIGKIARPHIAKWSDLILEMMPYLIKLVPQVKLVVIGVPKSRIKRIEKSVYKDNVIILEPTSNDKFIHSFYQSLDLLAHASKIGECNGNTLNEAMYWGKPVVVNSTPKKDNGQLEQVIHMKNGIIANYPQTYARAIAYLQNDSSKFGEMGLEAKNSILMYNKPEKIVGMLEKSIFEIMVEKGLFKNESFMSVYDSIEFFPSKNEIIEYIKEYKKRLKYDFDSLSFTEKLVNFLSLPKKLFYKIKDFLEDKLN